MVKHYTQLTQDLEHMLKRIETLEKKRKAMGLTKEEKEKIKELKTEYFVTYDEMIQDVINQYLIPYLLDADCLKWKDAVLEYIPSWNGGYVIRDAEFEAVCGEIDKLNEDQLKEIHNVLPKLHRRVLENLNKLADNREGYEALAEYGRAITGRELGNVLDTIRYIDWRYRDFAEMVGVDLEEVEIYTGAEDEDEE